MEAHRVDFTDEFHDEAEDGRLKATQAGDDRW